MAGDLLLLSSAIQDFRKARSQAGLKEVLARLRGESTQLLSYEEVRQQLKLKGSAEIGLREIPLDAIVGSVGRYTDFTRDFLPLQGVSQERWARIKMATIDLTGLPPIEVYKIGEAYFVKDGNHRVSVARQLGVKEIEAYVTVIRTRVPITPDVQPDELILKAEYAEFLEKTRLDELRPAADLSVTVPGKYPVLAEHIDVHRYFMGMDEKRFISYDEAVAHWYDYIYLPVVHLIRDQGILQSFPHRTETDLYIWIAEHRAAIEGELGWQIRTDAAATDLVSQHSTKTGSVVTRLGEKLLDVFTPESLETGPPPGQWRREQLTTRREDRLFGEILVPINGGPQGWYAVDQALVLAQREGALLHGLHVVSSEANTTSSAAENIKQEFNRRCQEAGVTGELVLADGEVTSQIITRARWTDLVVTTLAYPPSSRPLARLSSGFRELIQRCPRPVLATPQVFSPLTRALLAYDGSPKAEEALYVATYLAGQWGIALCVVTVADNNRTAQPTLGRARLYLELHGVEASSRLESGPVAETVLRVGREYDCDLLIMGGYSGSLVKEAVLGSTVDQVLRESHKPMLICR